MPDVKLFLNREHGIRLFTMLIFIMLSIASFGFDAYLFYVSNSAYTFAIAVVFLALSIVAGFFNIQSAIWYYKSYFYWKYLNGIEKNLMPLKRLPTVAVVVPSYNEDANMVKKNMIRLKTLEYPKNKIRFYLAEDSTNPEITEELRKFSEKNGIIFTHRAKREGFKAGALNNILKYSNEELVAIFDADEYLIDKKFLIDNVKYFSEKGLSYIQTEKRYKATTFFSQCVDIFDAFFFRFVEPARAMNNTAIFSGSCGIIRRSALDKIGGFPEYVIEDTFFSFESDMNNYKSLYIPKIYALGKPIETFSSLVKQQWRYNYGDTQFIDYYMRRSKPKKRSLVSSMDYIAHGFGLNYLSVFLILFTVCSIFITLSPFTFAHIDLSSLFNLSTMTTDLEILGFFAFSMSFLAPVFLAKIYFGSFKKGFMIFLLNYALAFVRARAALAAIFNKNPGANWNRQSSSAKTGMLANLYTTRVELSFSALLFGLSIFAYTQSNLAGSVWLAIYGMLYIFTTVFHVKYG